MISHDVPPPDEPGDTTWYAPAGATEPIGAVRLVVYVDPALKEQCRVAAAREQMSMSEYVEAVLTKHMAGGGK